MPHPHRSAIFPHHLAGLAFQFGLVALFTFLQLLDAELTTADPLVDAPLNSSTRRDNGLDREVLFLVLHVINNADPDIFHHWWPHLVSKDVEGVMRVFGFAVEAFEFKSTKRRPARNATILSHAAPQTPSANPELAAIAQRYQGIDYYVN